MNQLYQVTLQTNCGLSSYHSTITDKQQDQCQALGLITMTKNLVVVKNLAITAFNLLKYTLVNELYTDIFG